MPEAYDYHVFAHKDGRYQTVGASASVSAEERRVLEQFAFGQTNDPAYLASLDQTPGVMWRRAGRRYALTRVRNGQPDSSSRATLRFESILFEHEQAGAVLSSLSQLVLGQWQEREGRALLTPAGRSSQSLHPALVSDAALAVDGGRAFRAPAEKANLRDVEAIIQRCFHAPGFSLMFKSLAEHANATVNLVAGARSTDVVSAPREDGPVNVLRPRHATPPRGQRAGATVDFVMVALLLLNSVLLLAIAMRSPRNAGSAQESITSQINKVAKQLDGVQRQRFDEIAKLVQDRPTTTDLEERLATSVGPIEPRLSTLDNSLASVSYDIQCTIGLIESLDGQLAEMQGDQEDLASTAQNVLELVRWQQNFIVAEIKIMGQGYLDQLDAHIEKLAGRLAERKSLPARDLLDVRATLREMHDRLREILDVKTDEQEK